MDISLDLRNVTSVEMGEITESTNYCWRTLTIKTTQGDLQLTLYTREDGYDPDELKVRI